MSTTADAFSMSDGGPVSLTLPDDNGEDCKEETSKNESSAAASSSKHSNSHTTSHAAESKSSDASHHCKVSRYSVQSNSLTKMDGSASVDERNTTRTSDVSSTAPTQTTNRHEDNLTEQFPIARLKNSDQSLHGRSKELEILQKCLQELSSKKRNQLVTLKGYSGTGKSKLAMALKLDKTNNDEKNDSNKGLQVKGKFDIQVAHQRPYSAIIEACQEICAAILRRTREDQEHISQQIVKGLGEHNFRLLTDIIPALHEIVLTREGDDDDNQSLATSGSFINAKASSATSADEYRNKIHYAFITLFRILTRHFTPLVMVIDDLQSSDMSSLDLLETLLADREVRLMIIGTYRSNEVSESHSLYKRIQHWKDVQEQNHVSLTEIDIGNLSEAAVLEVVQEMLNTTDPYIEKLSDLCMAKTQGNVLFLKLLLSTLYEQHLLAFDFGKMLWKFDLEEIHDKIPSSDNVIDLVIARMDKLSTLQKYLLQLAQCLGAKFNLTMLHVLFLKLYNDSSSENNETDSAATMHELRKRSAFRKQLDDLETEGFVEKAGKEHYQFSHDRIQEASLLTLSSSEDVRSEFFHSVGSTLRQVLDKEDLEASIFVVTDLLNSGTKPTTEQSRSELSNLNRQSAQKAFAMSSFEATASYAMQGIELLGADRWGKENRSHTLELYTIAAKSEASLGNLPAMEDYCNEVISRNEILMKDKLAVYYPLVESITNQGKYEEACERILGILDHFNVKFASSPTVALAQTLLRIVNLKARVRSFCRRPMEKEEDAPLGQKEAVVVPQKGFLHLVSCAAKYVKDAKPLKVTRDPTQRELMRLLDGLVTVMYLYDDYRMPLVMLRGFDWTDTIGVTDLSPVFTSAVAIILISLEDYKLAEQLAPKAHELVELTAARDRAESRTAAASRGFVFCWTMPVGNLVPPLRQDYEKALKAGDTETASIHANCICLYSLMGGVPLDRFEDESGYYGIQFKNLKRIMYRAIQAFQQVAQNLMGLNSSEDLTVLQGDAIGTAEEVKEMMKADKLFAQVAPIMEAILCCWLGHHEKLAKRVLKEKGKDPPFMGAPILMVHVLFCGVSSFAAYQQNPGVAGYRRMGMLMRSKMKRWAKHGNPNVLHLDRFFDAEYEASCKGRTKQAIESFKEAFQMSSRIRHIHHSALIAERFAEFYLVKMDDPERASNELQQSLKLYREYKAFAKVDQLEEKYSRLLPQAPPPMLIVGADEGQELLDD